jgi:hypothetical protein
MKKEVDEYINKQPSPQKEICMHIRNLILKTLPGVMEEMKWGAPVFAGGKFYIGSLKDHVNLGFAISGLSKEEVVLFEGKGKIMRHIKIFSVNAIDDKKIAKLLKMVNAKATCEESC